MANLSQQKRERMLAFLDTLKKKNADDDDTLRAIGEIENELNSKKYGLVWEKHEEAVDIKMKDYIPVFTEDHDREITAAPGEDYNFLLEGDNLHSLKLLEKTHKGKIDVIYIDPPYNTGNKDFLYDDKNIDQNDAFRHSKWLSFMAKRLRIAKNLLSATGCILVSINDIENATLKMLCDEIFGDQNFIANFVWKSRQNKDNRNLTGVSVDHEYVLAYSKTSNIRIFKGDERDISQYKNPDNDPKGPWTSANMVGIATELQRPNLHYDLIDPNTGINYGKPTMGWRYDKKTMAKLIEAGLIIFPDSPSGRPRRKKYLSEIREVKPGFSSMIGDAIYTRDGTKDLRDIFPTRVFDFPKPVSLIKILLAQTSQNDSCILDFFAGSGTTAQAVLELNQEDGGNRHFILCTNNENNICENVTYPRVKTVITGIRPDGSKYSDGIPANLKCYKTDFVARNEEYLSDALLRHIAEMIQLENGIKLDGKRYLMILTDEQADEISSHWDQYPDVKAIYLSKNVLLTTDQEGLFENIPVYIIPDYYFDFELREEGESW